MTPSSPSQPLRNPRHERFVQALFEGEPASRAYEIAGYAPNDGNAIRMKGNERVQARLVYLQMQAAKSSEVTVESICRELDEANAVAKERGQAAAMVSASALRAKLAGLMVEKVELGPVGAFDKCDSAEAVAEACADALLDGSGGPTEQFRPSPPRTGGSALGP
jgi:hypothetical protein